MKGKKKVNFIDLSTRKTVKMDPLNIAQIDPLKVKIEPFNILILWKIPKG